MMNIEKCQFDREEQQIYDVLSKIKVEVNHERLIESVKCRLGEASQINVPSVRKKVPLFAAALVLLFFISATALAVGLGGFDWFLERFNPPFAEIVEPVEIYVEDQGIRLTVIGAQTFENMAILYLSVQDVSGENRVTERVTFFDSIHFPSPGNLFGGGFDCKPTLLYFDVATNTVYIELQFTMDAAFTFSNPLIVGIPRITLDSAFFYEPIAVSLSELTEDTKVSTIGHDISIFMISDESLFDMGNALVPEHVLSPGTLMPLPHGNPSQWISNIGIVDGQLRVQVGMYRDRDRQSGDGPGDPGFVLVSSADGSLLDAAFDLRILFNDNYDVINYEFAEFVFDVDIEILPYYTLTYLGSVHHVISGDWGFTVETDDTEQKHFTFAEGFPVEDVFIDFATLSPLGLNVRGRFSSEWRDLSELQVKLETPNGLILLEGGLSLFIDIGIPNQSFTHNWLASEPIDINAVTGILINDTRLPMSTAVTESRTFEEAPPMMEVTPNLPEQANPPPTLEGLDDYDAFIISKIAPEQLIGTWENDMGETYVISNEIPQGKYWIMIRHSNGSYRIQVESDCPAGYEKWFFPVGTEMIRYGTNWSLVQSDTSVARLFVGSFSLTTCCPDEEVLLEVFYNTTE